MTEASGDISPQPLSEAPELTPADVARLMGVTASTVSRWADEGKLPFFRTPGRQRRFRRSDVDRLIAAGFATSTEAAAS